MPFCLAICAFSFILLSASVNALNCSTNSGTSSYEPFPKKGYFPLFSTRMEIRLSSRNVTLLVEEWFDSEDEKGAVSMRSDDRSSGFWGVYYDKARKEIDHVLGKNCTSFEWTQRRFDHYRCRYPKNESCSLKLIGDACSANVLLDLVQKDKAINVRYLGEKTVRNIPVKGWRICKTETVVDFWYTINDEPVPVLIEARPDSALNVVSGLIHSYSFIDFVTYDVKLKVPEEVWCQGAAHSPPVPKLPRRFDVNLESVNTKTSRIRGVREYYDLDKQLFRVDFDARGTQPPFVGSGPSIDIRDMKTGKSTRYNQATGQCGEFQAREASVIKTRYNYRIDTPFGKPVLFEDPTAKPVYRGRAVTRRIECDVWQQTRVNWPGNVTGKQVWKWYFTWSNWVENKEPQPVPVKLEIEGTVKFNATFEAQLEFNLNFYASESQTPTPNAFDLSSLCVKDSATQTRSWSSGMMAGIAISCFLLGRIV